MSHFTTSAQALAGMAAFLTVAWLAGEGRRRVRWRSTLGALATQVVLATVILRVQWVRDAFLWLSRGINALKVATAAGTSFVFGYVGGAPTPYVAGGDGSPFVFAFQALPVIIVVSALALLLFHWGVLPVVVRGLSVLLSRSLRIGGALGLCAAAKVFLGPTEAPLLIRPYVAKLSRSELFTTMTLGMATTSAAVMTVYATILDRTVDNPIAHILTASVISLPAAVAVSRLMIPHEGEDTAARLTTPYKFAGAMDAVATGATDGMRLCLNIAAMLLAVLALVALVNAGLGHITVGDQPLSLQVMFGTVLSPVAWLMGIPWDEARAAGQLIGTKVALNEVMAFIELAKMPEGVLSDHSKLVMTYALCGFANFGSVGILIGGYGTLVPERRVEIIELGFRSLIAGSLCTCLSGTVVGLLT